MKLDQPTRFNHWNAVLALGAVAVLAAIIARDTGLYASVFGDEWTYSSNSRLTPIADAKIPSYLYLWIFRLTNQCGADFLSCARWLNAIFFVAATPFIYAVLKPYTSPGKAVALTLVAIAAPANSFTTLFMPESLYFFMFWVLSFMALRPYAARPWRYAAQCGAVLGLMCLVKLHALFLLGGLCAFVLIDALWPGVRGRLKSALIVLAATVAVFFAVRFGLGYVLGGKGALSLMGEFYSTQANVSKGQLPLDALIWNTMKSGWGHVIGLCMLFGPLLVAAVFNLVRGNDEQSQRARSAVLFGLTMLAALVTITAYFTASMSYSENIGRLHQRYYDFCLPLLLLGPLAWRGLEARPAAWKQALTRAATVIIALLMLYAATIGLRLYTPYFVDSPELSWVQGRRLLPALVGGIGAIACLSFIFGHWRKARLAALGYYVLIVAAGTAAATVTTRSRTYADVFVQAGQLLRTQYPDVARHGQLVGDQHAGLLKAKFYADSNALEVVATNPSGNFDKGLDWTRDSAVLFDDWELPPGSYHRKRAYEGFTVYWLRKRDTLDFSKPLPASVKSTRGLAAPESFGRWSQDKEVVLVLNEPISGDLQVTIEASAFGPNVGQPFSIALGDVEQPLLLGTTAQAHTLYFPDVADARSLVIRVPQPTSPQQLGIGQDPRLLGISLVRLSMGPKNNQPVRVCDRLAASCHAAADGGPSGQPQK